jgi:electron transfer flavoprotein-quinone oxidoreductase
VDFSRERPGDAIVVGAGPAGTAAAYVMAKAGLQVMLIEKGQKPGSKNVMGGILYTHNLAEVVGEEWKQAPVERPIIEEQRWMMTPDAAIRLLAYKNFRNRQHPHSYSVLRARFDPWFAAQAEEAGSFLLGETVVDSLVVEGGRVIGVSTGREGEVFANVTVVCEGVGLGARLLEKAGLKKPLKANEVAMAYKEVIALDPGKIEDRFNCDPGEGASIECFGEATRGLSGFAFIYTNKETLSVGAGALLSELCDTRLSREELARRTPNAVLENFKNHPSIRPLLQGGETVEYLGHQIPEGGYRAIPKVYGPGYLVCGDAAMLSNPVHREGSNLAMASGRMAGETVVHSKETGDFSEKALAAYRLRLWSSWVIDDMKKYDRAVPLLEHNPKMLGEYPQLLDRALDEFFRVDGTSKFEKQRRILRMFRKEGGIGFLVDQLKAARALRIPF